MLFFILQYVNNTPVALTLQKSLWDTGDGLESQREWFVFLHFPWEMSQGETVPMIPISLDRPIVNGSLVSVHTFYIVLWNDFKYDKTIFGNVYIDV